MTMTGVCDPSTAVPRVKIGALEVSKQGLGCMGMSDHYGPLKPEQDNIDLIRRAIKSGITLLDTSDVYGPFTNEELIGKAIKGMRDQVQIATKFGVYIAQDGKRSVRGDPEYVRSCCEASLRRLDVHYIDLYYQHRIDPKVPIEITVGEMKKLVEEGKVKHIGLSEASPAEIRRAHAVHPIAAVQVEWSLWARDIEEELVPTCRELGIGIVCYSPLGRGFFSGKAIVEDLEDGDIRKYVTPRFSVENLEKNKALYLRLSAIASKKNCTAGQLALAWLQHQGDDVVPIPGTTRVKNFEENVGSLHVSLTKEDLKEIEDAVPQDDVVGDRYADMSWTWKVATSPPLSSWPLCSTA